MPIDVLSSAAKIGGVKKIAIVDDAYNPPKLSEIKEDPFNKFALACFDDDELQQEFQKLASLSKEDVDDYEDFIEKEELIVQLWNLHVGTASDQISEKVKQSLIDLFDDISTDRLDKLSQLAPLEKLVEGLECELIRLGSDPDPSLVAKADVVFLDLYLSEEIPPEVRADKPIPRSAYERARDRALQYLKAVREVTAKEVNSIAPAFILISSQGSDQKAENFRKSAGQMKSRFRFVSKQAIGGGKAHELLAIVDIFRTCKACSVVEPIQKAWNDISHDAISWVSERLLDLDISDFGHLYNYKLQKEGQPLADYVKDLVAGAIAERICFLYGQMNLSHPAESPFKEVPSFYQYPSNGFAELYSATKLSLDKGYRGKTKCDPQSGDIFMRETGPEGRGTVIGREVIAVMTSPCDLIDRDGTGPSAKSLLLLQGVMKPMTFKQEDPQVIPYNEKFYEIYWDKKHPLTAKINDLRQDWKENKITWVGRLKTEFFLELKANFMNDLGRVGLIKAPVIYEPLAGSITVVAGGAHVPLAEAFNCSKKFAFLFSDQTKPEIENQQVAFSGEFIVHLIQALENKKECGDLPQAAREKIAGILDRSAQVVKMIEKKNASSHCIQNYLTVEIHELISSPAKENKEGIITIRLWRD